MVDSNTDLRYSMLGKQRTTITLENNALKILDKFCKNENRSRSNMIEQMVYAYDKLHNY